MIDPDLPVSHLPSIGTSYTQKLAKLDIFTIKDLLYHVPAYYQDTSATTPISKLQAGDVVTLTGSFAAITSRRISGNRSMQTGKFTDDTGSVTITWFNQPFLTKSISTDQFYNLSGKAQLFRGKLTLTSPQYELLNNTSSTIHTAGMIPQYHQTAGVTSKWLRRQIYSVIQHSDFSLTEFLPETTLTNHQLVDLTTAIKHIHFPQNSTELDNARKRLAFQEMLLYQLAAYSLKSEWSHQHQAVTITHTDLANQLLQSLPYTLTPAQIRCISEISADLNQSSPMHRLLQGDVGSGKTIVAALAAARTIDSGYKTLLMAPTQVLAGQHFATFQKLFQNLPVTIGLLTSNTAINHQTADIIIGTHAILHREPPRQIGLVIIDEQHRFGVEQRAKLLKTNPTPHLLTLTATPIPRTIALSLYAQIDISYLDELPPGRKLVTTKLVSQAKKSQAYDWIGQQIQNNRSQVFYVCPLINDSTTPKLDQVKAVTSQYQHLSQAVFPDFRIGLLHGQMTATEKQQILDDFHAHSLDILVSTPVIEVGVDIKNATIMVIESAERFGLASLHQLRGRVGRSDKKSYCLLFTSTSQSNQTRLKYLETIHEGTQLAQIDLEVRGPGHLFGTEQSGYINLKVASLTDLDLIQTTHKEAQLLVKNLTSYPQLQQATTALLENITATD